MIEALECFPNVIFEIANEANRCSINWQKWMVGFVKKLTDKPVGVSYVTRTTNDWMKDSGADWFAPEFASASRPNLPGPDGYDSDHAWQLRCLPDAMRQAADNGMYVWLMDDYNNILRVPGVDMAPCRETIQSLLKEEIRDALPDAVKNLSACLVSFQDQEDSYSGESRLATADAEKPRGPGCS